MSKIITKETLTSLRVWELPKIDNDTAYVSPNRDAVGFSKESFARTTAPPAPSASPSPNEAFVRSALSPTPPPPPPEVEKGEKSPVPPSATSDDLKTLVHLAYEEGFARGQQEGITQGFAQGERDGLAKGLEEGRKQGFAQGKQEGVTSGLEEGRRDGLSKGVEQGYREGLAKGEAETKAKLVRLAQILHLLDQPLADLDAEVEKQIVALALSLARQLVRRELRINASGIVPIVHEALAQLPTVRRNVRLFLPPDDLALVRAALELGEGDQAIRLVEDATILPGGCRVETDASHIDATLERRMEQVIAGLLGASGEPDSV